MHSKKYKLLSALLVVVMLIGLWPVDAWAQDETVSYVSYEWDDNEQTLTKNENQSVENYTTVTNETTSWGTTNTSSWYVVKGEVTISERIKVTGAVNLILTNGSKLNAEKGIDVSQPDNSNETTQNTLNIYAQTTTESENVGELVATGESGGAGIGGNGTTVNFGNINVHGGAITAKGGERAAGIGGGGYMNNNQTFNGNINIYGGTVNVIGGAFAAGIGGGADGYSGLTINIYGGDITAETLSMGSGIGLGTNTDNGTTTINIAGGMITARGSAAAGIGNGHDGKSNTVNITISGGSVDSRSDGSQYSYAGIGDSGYSDTNNPNTFNIIISGGTVTAVGKVVGIGGDSSDSTTDFSTGTNGNAVIFTNGITDETEKNTWSGIISTSEQEPGIIYGDDYTVEGTLTLPGSVNVEQGQELTVPVGSTLVIPENVTLENDGTVSNQGTVTNNGVFDNDGAITNNAASVSGGGFTNTGTLDNGGTITNAGSLENTGTLENSGTVTNTNTGTLENNGTVDNKNTFKNDGSIINNGVSGSGGGFTNTGTLDNGGTITNNGSLTNNGTVSGDGKLENEGSGTVTKKDQSTPNAPTLSANDENSITVNTVQGQKYAITTSNQAPALSESDEWKNSANNDVLIFSNLASGTCYYIWTYKTGNAYYNDSQVSSALTVYTALKITTTALSDATVGAQYNEKLEANVADGAAVTWNVTGLPEGLKLEENTITGTPTTVNEEGATVAVTATVGNGTDSAKSAKELILKVQPGTMPGSVTISGDALIGNTLTANYTGNVSNVTYQWYRNDAVIADATSNTYTLTKNDVDQKIHVVVTSEDSNYQGSVSSDEITVGKMAQNPPSAPVVDTVTTNSITVESMEASSVSGATVEFSIDDGQTWQSETTFTNLSSGTTYEIVARYAETDTYNASLSSAVVTVTTRSNSTPSIPSQPSGDDSVWDEILDEIDGAESGDTIKIEMDDETEVPGIILEEIAGKNITVEIAMGDGIIWKVDGQNLPTNTDFDDIDLSVTMNTDGIPAEVVNAVSGGQPSVQITLSHDGPFGFVLTLTAPLGEENAGYWANLYHYDEDAGALNFETSGVIAEDGSVQLQLSHASQYAIVIDDHSHSALPFTDVRADDWFYDVVGYVYNAGLMTGTSDSEFSPNVATTRGMIVAILHRLEGSPTVTTNAFSDVDVDDWYAQAVNWAASEGIVGGFGDGTFAPNAPITREQMASILYRYSDYKGMDVSARADLSRYSDAAAIGDWATDVLSWANATGLITGMSADTIVPQGEATRAQTAAVLQRYLEM